MKVSICKHFARLDHQLAWNPPRIPLTHHMTLLVKITEERKDL